MQESLRELVGRTEVYNVSGAGGTIGLSQFVRFDGDASQLMATGLIMVGAVVANHSQYSLDDTTPLARLTTDYQVIVRAQELQDHQPRRCSRGDEGRPARASRSRAARPAAPSRSWPA